MEVIILEPNPTQKSWVYEYFNEVTFHTKEQFENLKNNKMKITENTTIKELIPEGWELKPDFQYDFDFKLDFERKTITIPIKKKEVKDFDWYVRKYLLSIDGKGLDNLFPLTMRTIEFKSGSFDKIPFESRIGLLKFICDDLKSPLVAVIEGSDPYYGKVMKIIPKEFLELIFA